MLTKPILTVVAVLTVLIACVAPASAQIVYGQPAAGQTSVVYNHWKIEAGGVETTLTQLMTPVTAFVPVRDNFDLTFYSSNSSNSLEALGQELDLNGLGDVRLQGNHSFMGDQLLVSAGLNLPTGKKKLSQLDEIVVLQTMSLNFIDLPMRRFGEGFGFNVLVGGAAVLGEGVRGGAGIMYGFVGAYEPYENGGSFDPGNTFSVNAGIDIAVDEYFWSINAIYSVSSVDKFEGIESFKQSPQLDLRASVSTGGDGAVFSGLARYVVRGKNTDYDILGVKLEEIKLYGNELSLAGAVDFPLGAKLHARPAADLRMISTSGLTFVTSTVPGIGDELELGGSTVLGIGGGLGYKVSENFDAGFGIKLYTGHAADGDIDLSGYQLTFGLSASM